MINFGKRKSASKKASDIEAYLDVLVEDGLIKKDQITPLEEKYKNIDDLYQGLFSLGTYPEEKLIEDFAKAIDFPYIKLTSIDKKAFEVIDQQHAHEFGFIPFSLDEKNKVIQVAIVDPTTISRINEDAIKNLESKLDYKIELFLASRKSLQAAMEEKPQDTSKTIDLSSFQIPDEILKKIPFDIAQKYKTVIFKQVAEKEFDVASTGESAELEEILSYVQNEGKIKLNLYFAPEDQIDKILQRYATLVGDISSIQIKEPEVATPQEASKKSKDPLDELASNIQNKESATSESLMENPDLMQFLGKESVSVADLKAFTEANQIPQLLAAMIFLAVKERASDIHIEPFEKAVRVRFRIDGELSDVIILPSNLISPIVARIKILSHLKLDEQRVPQDGRFGVKIGEESIDVRVSTLPTVFGEKGELRLLSKSYQLQKLEDLGLEGKSYDRIIEAISKPYGVLLSTGPTGSGKSTSLYAILFRLNRPEVNIITLEDPVEYEIQGVNQTQIKPQIGFGFAEGLRSVLRQDPNIIMVGEIRDQATAELVTHAALTGHLVLSTLHTNNAASALPRLINLGVEPFLLTSSVNAVIGQRLVRRICSKCREEVEIPAALLYEVKQEFAKINYNQALKFYHGRGCTYCKGGFKGRIGIFEVLVMSDAIEDMVLEKKPSDDIFTQAVKEGMITMKQDGLMKAAKGLTTVDEVLRVTSES